VYAQLRSTVPEGGLYDANEVTSDEVVSADRGPDWNDNGQWIDCITRPGRRQYCDREFLQRRLGQAYTGVARANCSSLGRA